MIDANQEQVYLLSKFVNQKVTKNSQCNKFENDQHFHSKEDKYHQSDSSLVRYCQGNSLRMPAILPFTLPCIQITWVTYSDFLNQNFSKTFTRIEINEIIIALRFMQITLLKYAENTNRKFLNCMS